MGLIKAAVSSVGGVLKDSWLETIEPAPMSDTTVMVSGVKVKGGKNKGNDNVISNGSVIHVYPNMMMLLIDSGKVTEDIGIPSRKRGNDSSTAVQSALHSVFTT